MFDQKKITTSIAKLIYMSDNMEAEILSLLDNMDGMVPQIDAVIGVTAINTNIDNFSFDKNQQRLDYLMKSTFENAMEILRLSRLIPEVPLTPQQIIDINNEANSSMKLSDYTYDQLNNYSYDTLSSYSYA